MGHPALLRVVEDVTVVIPTIAPRAGRLAVALESVHNQTVQVANTVISEDTEKKGAALNRDKGLAGANTEWVAFLDDDDFFYPQHIEHLIKHARKTGADLVYPWFDVFGGTDPFPQFEGQAWDPANPHQFPVTFLCKTELAWEIGGFSGGWIDENNSDEYGNRAGEDWNFITKFNDAGYKIVHLNERTWGWNHWANPDGSTGNTSGLPTRW